MVKLLLDVGNSRCKCAEYDAASAPGAFYWHRPVAANVGACVPARTHGEVGAIAVASVRGGEFNRRLSDALAARFGVRPVFAATERTACGVTTAYRRAADLGVDRFLALIGAWLRVGGACVVADCGTALTIDGVNHNGVHQGGVIMPGLRLLKSSLVQRAERLYEPGDDGAAEDVLFARDSRSAVLKGCRRMFMRSATDTIREMRTALGDGVAVVVTGGDGGLLLEAGEAAVEHRPHLVLEGLAAFSQPPPRPAP